MKQRRVWQIVLLLALLTLLLGACSQAATPAPAASNSGAKATAAPAAAATEAPAASAGSYQIPTTEEGKYNVAFVYVGPHDDGGWTQAHDTGRMYVEKNVPDVHTAYVENVAEGADAEQVIRSLARKGFNVIFTRKNHFFISESFSFYIIYLLFSHFMNK